MRKIVIAYSIFFITVIGGFIFFLVHDNQSHLMIEHIEFPQKTELADENSFIEETTKEISAFHSMSKKQREQAPVVEEKNIRVLIKSTGYRSIFHDKISFSCTTDLKMITGNQVQIIAKNTPYTLSKKHGLQESLILMPKNQGEISFSSISRKDNVSYQGKFEIFFTSNGIVLVNELPVEDYLKGVVPSEMPASYPIEALKAQAVVARSYAYYHMNQYAYEQYKAHVDDSTSYQVYQNIQATSTTDQSVESTKNVVVSENGKIKECMYFSTSAGILPQKETAFRQKIQSDSGEDIERQEGWYRWNCQYIIDFDTLKKRLLDFGTKEEKNGKVIEKSTLLKSITIGKRGENGKVEQITLKTNAGEVTITDQYVIRKLLAVKGTTIYKKDDTTFTMGDILPSPYFYFKEVDIKNGKVRLSLLGGGFGHGEGLSQNGAKTLALQGKEYQKILLFYYQ